MSSYKKGKPEVKWYVVTHLPKGAECLDVGACDGEYANLLGDYLTMDAVEVWEPNILGHHLKDKYRMVIADDIRNVEYIHYDLVIFGDIIEHLTVEDAQRVIEYAKQHSDMIIVAVPYQFKQDAMYGNPYERHIQDDLTEDIFMERYKGFTLQIPYANYGYFVWTKVRTPPNT